MSQFDQIQFLTSANNPEGFPDDTGGEVAFAGRSNAGKSSAINVLTNRRNLARTSKTPGRTQLINFFDMGGDKRLVDLPGYGFAKVPKNVQKHWQDLMTQYFSQRKSLKGMIVVMDSRRPLMPFDQRMLEYAGDTGCPVHILLTKADKLSRGAAAANFEKTRKQLSPGVGLQLFSALKKQGLKDASDVVEAFLAMAD